MLFANQGRTFRLLSLLFVGALCGCIIRVSDGSGGTSGGGSSAGDGGNSGPVTIKIKVANSSDVSLDPQIYVSDQFASIDQLFVPANKYTAYGVGTIGILADNDNASFTVDCAGARTIGTLGGSFGNDLNYPVGSGRQIVVRLDESISCGQTLSLTYRASGKGFTTDFSVE